MGVAQTPYRKSRVHLLNPFSNAFGGSELRSIAMFEVLAQHGDVSLWATAAPHPELAGRYPIRLIEPHRGIFPRGGTAVFVGVYFEVPSWVGQAGFERIVVLHNISLPNELKKNLEALKVATRAPIEIVLASPALEPEAQGLGVHIAGCQPSWIDLERFHPSSERLEGPFTVGRLSRDVPEKFHQDAVPFFRRLADEGFRIRIMGGTCIADGLSGVESIEILPAGAVSAAEFLRSLDAFVYQTSSTWFEAFGRVVVEAMATGVVPVVHRWGGYASVVESGKDGYLYSTDEEATSYLKMLRESKALRDAMSRSARAKVEMLYGETMRKNLVDYFFRPR